MRTFLVLVLLIMASAAFAARPPQTLLSAPETEKSFLTNTECNLCFLAVNEIQGLLAENISEVSAKAFSFAPKFCLS